jgi:magnesium transporter
VSLDAFVYTPEGIEQHEGLETALTPSGEMWIDEGNLKQTKLKSIRDRFDIHKLAVEDILDPQARAKTEEYTTHTFVLVKTTELSQRNEIEFKKEVRTHPVGFFIGDDWLVVLSPSGADTTDLITPRWVDQADRIADRGTDFLAYRLIDAIVDEYFLVLDDIETNIELVEEHVLSDPDPSILEDLNDVRRDLLAFRKVAWPAREAVSQLSRGDIRHVADENEKYFRDVYNHLVQVVDLIETYRDLTGGSRDIYLNAVSQSTNDVMKTLTVVATIFIPLTFVAGVYGMNFSGSPFAMPELYWTYGYPAVMLVMALIAGIMAVHFRRQNWL